MPKRFIRKTKGFNAIVFVGKAINYTDDTTYGAFVLNAPLGEIGIFDANLATHTDAITASEEFFFAQRTTVGIKKSPNYKLADLAARKQLYVAPVKQISSVGWSGTGGSIVNPTLVAGQLYGLKIMETTDGQDPYPTWNYEYTVKTGDVAIDIMRAMAASINNNDAIEHKLNARLVSAKVKSDATYGNYTVGATTTLTFTNGSKTAVFGGTVTFDIAVNDLISIDAAATPSDSIGDIYKVVAINGTTDLTLDRIYTGTTIAMNQAQMQGTRLKKVTSVVDVGIELTSLDFETHFKLAVWGYLENAILTYTTPFTAGNGTSDQVGYFEWEGQIFDGETTKNAQFAAKFGTEDTFTVAAETYDMYSFNFLKSEAGIAPVSQRVMRSHVVICNAKSGGNLGTTLNTLFGL